MNMLIVRGLFALCFCAVVVQGRSKSPLIDEDGPRIINRAAECVFGSQVRELGSSWVPDLGVPIGVLYCMKCECVPSQRKRRIVARVQCRSIKNECPEPTCDEPVLSPGNCCKSCPGDNYSEEIHDVVPQNVADVDEKSGRHYAALLTGRSSLVMKNDDLKPIPNDNKNNVIATGRFTFQKKNLYFSFYISDKAARPRSLQFVDKDANILEEIVLSGVGGISNSVYQNATRKVCGVWKRIPRAYRLFLKNESLYVVLVWGIKDQAEFMLSGKITKYIALGTELFSALLEPAPGSNLVEMAGSGGTAIVSTSTTLSPSVHIAIVFNGIFTRDETSDVYVDVTLSLDEKKQIILQEKIKVPNPAHELNLVEISSPVNAPDLRQLTRGRLALSIASTSHPTALKLTGSVMTKATCELFQTTLSPTSPSTTDVSSGLAWLFLNNEGSLVFNIQVDGLQMQQIPILISLVDVSNKQRKVDLEELLTPYFKDGWANGTVEKIGPKLLEPLYSGDLAVNIATQNESSLIRGKLSPKLVADARDAPAPILLKRQIPTTVSGMVWLNMDNECNIHYDVSLTGLSNQDYQLELILELLPKIAPGAPVTRRKLGDIHGNSAEGSPLELLQREDLFLLEFGVCFLRVYDVHNNITLLKNTVKQFKVPSGCLPSSMDNDVPTLNDFNAQATSNVCLYEERFYQEEASWTSINDPCTMCYCRNGSPQCYTTTCPELNCTNGIKSKRPNECCPICTNFTPSEVDIPTGCTFGGKFYQSGSKFHPFLIPNGFDFCTECSCEETEVKCTRRGNERLCCKNCNLTKNAVDREMGDAKQESEPSWNKKPIYKPRKSPEQILKEGGCKNPSNAMLPYENGQKFHPFIVTLGEFRCVNCKCKDGNGICERMKCTKTLCHKIFKSQRNNTLNPNSMEACCLDRCKKSRRHHNRLHNKS